MNNYILPIGASDDPALVGGKAASLARMARLGLAVPPGFVLTTDAFKLMDSAKHFLVWDCLTPAMSELQKNTDKLLGSGHRPLFVSVRSGAPVSMPGMMDTILNVGMTLEVAEAMIERDYSDEWVWPTFGRFLTMYADAVLADSTAEVVKQCFQESEWYGTPITKEMCLTARSIFLNESFAIDDVEIILKACIIKVFQSWNSERAVEYRAMHGIPDDLGTAVTIQQMVFGNAPSLRGPSATGVLFSRNLNTGENELWGEWLENAQGEDVVAGLRPAKSIQDMQNPPYSKRRGWLDLCVSLFDAAVQLEAEYRDAVDIEWTIENGKLWFLQCRIGKRSAEATVRIAVDMANEGIITREEAIQRVKPVARLLAKQTLVGNPTPIATGDNASYGVASGVVVFSSLAAKTVAPTTPVILVRRMTDPQDVGGMNVAAAILTQEGGPFSHAAVVARELGKPCVTGASIVLDTIYFDASGHRYFEGDWLTVDGTNGNAYAGAVEFATTNDNPYLATLKEWGL